MCVCVRACVQYRPAVVGSIFPLSLAIFWCSSSSFFRLPPSFALLRLRYLIAYGTEISAAFFYIQPAACYQTRGETSVPRTADGNFNFFLTQLRSRHGELQRSEVDRTVAVCVLLRSLRRTCLTDLSAWMYVCMYERAAFSHGDGDDDAQISEKRKKHGHTELQGFCEANDRKPFFQGSDRSVETPLDLASSLSVVRQVL